MEKSGKHYDKIAKIIYYHDNYNNFKRLATALEIPIEKTNVEMAMLYGHMGTVDLLLGLNHIVQNRDNYNMGEIIATLSMGNGWKWACSLFELV